MVHLRGDMSIDTEVPGFCLKVASGLSHGDVSIDTWIPVPSFCLDLVMCLPEKGEGSGVLGCNENAQTYFVTKALFT